MNKLEQNIIKKFTAVGINSNFDNPAGSYGAWFLGARASEELNLTEEEIDYLIYRTNINSTSDDLETLLNSYFIHKTNIPEIKKEHVNYLFENCDLNKFNIFGFNSLHCYFRNAREQEIKLNKKQISRLIKECEYEDTNTIYSAWELIVEEDYGYTKLKTEDQIIFLRKVKECTPLNKIFGILNLTNKIEMVMDSFDLENPEILNFFEEVCNYAENKKDKKYPIKKLEARVNKMKIENSLKKTNNKNFSKI